MDLIKDPLGRLIKDFSNELWFDIPRKEIEWYPKIDYEKCIGCGTCYVICKGRVVYDWDFKNMRPIVARPYNCMVGCSTCANLCPAEAIMFPPKEKLIEIRNKAQVVLKSRKIIDGIKEKR